MRDQKNNFYIRMTYPGLFDKTRQKYQLVIVEYDLMMRKMKSKMVDIDFDVEQVE